MKDNKRAIRRHHRERLNRRAVNICLYHWGMIDSPNLSSDDVVLHAKRVRDNLKNCSCHMCCNPRRCKYTSKHEQLTIQERKRNNWREEYEEGADTYSNES